MNKEAVREFKRGLITEAAYRLLHDRSYADVTVQDIADEAQIGKATLYQYFNSKEEIVFSLMMRSVDEVNRQVEFCCTNIEDPREALERITSLTYRLYLKNNQLFLTYLGLKLTGAFKAEWLEEVRQKRERKFEILASIIDKGIEQGIIMNVDSMLLARVINNFLRGLSLEPLEVRTDSDEADNTVNLELIKTILFSGIFVDGGGRIGE